MDAVDGPAESPAPRISMGLDAASDLDEVQVHAVPVSRTARVCTLGGGQGPIDEVWIACHGYRQLAGRFIRRFQEITSPRRLVVAPEALSRFYLDSGGGRHGPEARVGGTWMTREDREHEIADYVRYLDVVARRFCKDPSVRRVAFGFSQGVHTVARWALMGQTALDRVILWGAYLPSDLDLVSLADRWKSLDVVQVHGEEDGSRSDRLAAEQDARLAESGLAMARRFHSGGHEVDRALLGELASEWPSRPSSG